MSLRIFAFAAALLLPGSVFAQQSHAHDHHPPQSHRRGADGVAAPLPTDPSPAPHGPAVEAPAPGASSGHAHDLLEELRPRHRYAPRHEEPAVIEEAELEDEGPDIVDLWGPRLGVTAILGEEGEMLRQRLGLDTPVMTQFGWQIELRFFQQESGWMGINELLLMIGGLEQGMIIPTASWIVGLRTPIGFEVGAGPVINFLQMASAIERGTFGLGPIGETGRHRSLEGIGVALAAGMAIPIGEVRLPINLAVVPNRDGVRLTLLLGFTLPGA